MLSPMGHLSPSFDTRNRILTGEILEARHHPSGFSAQGFEDPVVSNVAPPERNLMPQSIDTARAKTAVPSVPLATEKLTKSNANIADPRIPFIPVQPDDEIGPIVACPGLAPEFCLPQEVEPELTPEFYRNLTFHWRFSAWAKPPIDLGSGNSSPANR